MVLRVVFAGSDAIALPCLEVLLQSEYEICGVFTQPDRPAGRGRKITAGPIKVWAMQQHIPVLQPEKIDEAALQQLRDLKPDLVVVMAYGIIVPQAFLDIPRLGCVNLHVSLLPAWRGAAPIQRAILAGDAVTGVSMMQMNAGLDTGDILAQYEQPICATTTCVELQQQLAQLSAAHICTLIRDLDAAKIKPVVQDDACACYAPKMTKAEAHIDWHCSAEQIERMIRAFNPWPVAYTLDEDNRVRIWHAKLLHNDPHAYSPGEIIAIDSSGVDVAASVGVIRVTELQFAGKRRMLIADAIHGVKQALRVGIILH